MTSNICRALKTDEFDMQTETFSRQFIRLLLQFLVVISLILSSMLNINLAMKSIKIPVYLSLLFGRVKKQFFHKWINALSIDYVFFFFQGLVIPL